MEKNTEVVGGALYGKTSNAGIKPALQSEYAQKKVSTNYCLIIIPMSSASVLVAVLSV